MTVKSPGVDEKTVVNGPAPAPVYDLDELLNQLTEETFHEEIYFGSPVGREVW